MARRRLPRAALAWLLCCAAAALAHTAPAKQVHDLSLLQIDQPGRQRIALGDFRGKVLMMLLFEDQCRYCLQSIAVADALARDQSEQVALVAVGVGGNTRALNDWVQRVRPKAPVAWADRRLLARIGGVAATPLLIIVDHQGVITRRVLGSVDQAELIRLLAETGVVLSRQAG